MRGVFGWRVGQWLFRSLHQRFAPSLRLTVCGGAALNPELAWKLEGLGCQLIVGYGMTGRAPNISYDHPDSLRIASAGKPFPSVQVRLMLFAEWSGRDQAYGEVQVRAPMSSLVIIICLKKQPRRLLLMAGSVLAISAVSIQRAIFSYLVGLRH
ncbi:long-chain acyl-CoA synthetase [Nitrosomonas communis]|uniref:Long-chain acyl-CoA synthetase n=1 Tax=Nitrosomonas communis TaxID=44574 RepID=A0A1I4JPQ4_9PROT|nr:long-chain acyl-CoA synthetase [Nitrosomonas communis]